MSRQVTLKASWLLFSILAISSSCLTEESHPHEKALLEFDYEWPSQSKVVTKLVVHDGSKGDNPQLCSHEILSFKKMRKYDCSFIIDSVEYNLKTKYLISENGRIKEYWHYLPEGPLIHREEDFEDDRKFYSYIGGDEFRVELFESFVIDSGDTLRIVNFDEELGLVFVDYT